MVDSFTKPRIPQQSGREALSRTLTLMGSRIGRPRQTFSKATLQRLFAPVRSNSAGGESQEQQSRSQLLRDIQYVLDTVLDDVLSDMDEDELTYTAGTN